MSEKNTQISEAYKKVLLSRDKDRPSGKFFIDKIVENFIEFKGDRLFGEDEAIVGGIGYIGGYPVTAIAIDKGTDLDERMKKHFGSASPEGYRKAQRLMKQAEKFKRPVIAFVDTSGAYPGKEAEERGQAEAIAKNLYIMSDLKTPILTVIVGQGGSGGALALAVSDEVWILENAVYSVISPEGCASILFKDSGKAEYASEALKMTAEDLWVLGAVEKIIKEHKNNFEKTAKLLKVDIIDFIERYDLTKIDEIVENRYKRFRKF